jgi:hypothetical protein
VVIVEPPVRAGRLPTTWDDLSNYVQAFYDLTKVQVYDSTGRPVDARAVVRMLEQPVRVLVSADGRGVDPRYLAREKKDTLILVLPRTKPATIPPQVPGGGFVEPENPVFPLPVGRIGRPAQR